MYRRIIATIAVFAGALSLGGCVQMTRHSNTMVFGTNTSFGISVGSDATSTPSITVGYKRQEAVIMPLVANTEADGEKLNPCKQMADGSLPESCILMGRTNDDTGNRDTYSVLASFGAKFGATSTQPEAKGAIAQYFATGLAARTLADRAGAAAVAASPAAVVSASVDSRRVYETMILKAADVATNLANKASITTVADVKAAMAALDSAIGSGSAFALACSGLDKAACVAVIRNRSTISLIGLQPTLWDAASKHAF
jgi:hypothetical protein